MIVLANNQLLTFLNDKIARLSTYRVHLYVNDVDPQPGSIISDFVEANFHGYSSQLLTGWGTVYLAEDGLAQVNGPVLTFTPSDDVLPQTIYGWFATDSVPNFVMGEKYGDPMGFLLDGPERSFIVQPRFQDTAIA